MCAAATEPVVLLAAGGTGGHLFPALALAQELGRRKVTVDLVTDSRGDRYGSTFPARSTYTIRSATHAGWSPLSAARAAMNLTWGTSAAFRLLGRIRPSAVIGFGGYPTLPPLAAAALRKIPAAVHEQNAVLGRANRLMRARASAIATSFAETRFVEPNLRSKTYLTGNPVRDIVIEWSAKPYRPASNGEPFRVVVFGGSQGARFLSDVVPEALLALAEPLRTRLEVTQQCRAEDLERVQAVYTRGGIKSELAPFFGNLPERLASAHLVIGRAGASTVAELTVLGRPAVLIPLPHALDNDQLHNATRLAEAGAAWCIEQKELDRVAFVELLARLMSQPGELQSAAEAARGLGRPDAARRLADVVEMLIGRRGDARGIEAKPLVESRVAD